MARPIEKTNHPPTELTGSSEQVQLFAKKNQRPMELIGSSEQVRLFVKTNQLSMELIGNSERVQKKLAQLIENPIERWQLIQALGMPQQQPY